MYIKISSNTNKSYKNTKMYLFCLLFIFLISIRLFWCKFEILTAACSSCNNGNKALLDCIVHAVVINHYRTALWASYVKFAVRPGPNINAKIKIKIVLSLSG